MNKTMLLLRPAYLGLFGLNKLRNTGDAHSRAKAKWRVVGVVAVTVLIAGSAFGYAMMMGHSFSLAGCPELLLPLYMAITSAATMVTTILRAGSTLYRFRDYDLVMSLPVSLGTVAASRLMRLYALNAAVTFCVMLPALAAQLLFMPSAGAAFWVSYLVTLPLIQLLPVVAAAVVGTLVTWTAAHFRRSNMLQIVLMFVVLVASLAVSTLSGAAAENFSDIGSVLVGGITRAWLPAALYMDALGGDWLALVIFCALSLGVAALFCFVFGRTLPHVHALLEGVRPRGKAANLAAPARGRSPFAALLAKEARRYFSSALYVTNTGFGVVLLLIGSAVLLFLPPDMKATFLADPEIAPLLTGLLPLAVAFMTGTVETAASSISLEGKSWWIVRSLPVPARTLLGAKLALNLLVVAIPLAPGCVLLTLALGLSAWEGLWLFTVGMVFGVFTAVFGLFVNLLMPKFDWPNETAVIKQSAPVGIVLIAIFALTFAPIMLQITLPVLSAGLVTGLATAVAALASLVFGILLLRRGEVWLART